MDSSGKTLHDEWSEDDEPAWWEEYDDSSYDFGPMLPDPAVPFRYAYSMGGGCFVAKSMAKNGLRKASGPFDYMVATPALVAHCLADDFKSFLDVTRVFKEKAGFGHYNLSTHANREHYGALFKHYTLADWETALPSRVQRFRNALRKPERKLLIAGCKGQMVPADVDLLFRALIGFGCYFFDLVILNVVGSESGDAKVLNSSFSLSINRNGWERIITCRFSLSGELVGATLCGAGDKRKLSELFSLMPKYLASYEEL